MQTTQCLTLPCKRAPNGTAPPYNTYTILISKVQYGIGIVGWRHLVNTYKAKEGIVLFA